jgi:hypothetical protein
MPSKLTDLQAAENHKYRLGGQELVNVTTISGLIDDGKSGGMAGAAAKLTREGINYRQDWDATRDLGSRVHGHLEKWMRDEEIQVPNEEMPFVDALEKWIIDDNPQMIEQECVVLSSLGYGGRPDWIGTITREDWPTGIGIIDLKAGKIYPIEHSLQICAYSRADGIGVYDEEGNLMGLRPLPKIEWGADLYVRDDGTYRLERYPITDDVFEVFCGLLHAYRWTRNPEMKQLVKESMAYNKSIKEARELVRKGNQ